jgi:hypothetical protein
MSAVRWVCLSDLHFGAENSLLTHLPAHSLEVDATTTGPVLERFVACLRELVGPPGSTPRPELVLNGDVLEFALATDNVAAMAFDRFIDLAYDPADPLFGPVIYYVPGNHDHHLWEVARERQYSDYVRTVPPETDLEEPWHVTRLFERSSDRPVAGDALPPAELLGAILRRRLGDDSVTVKIAYPNLGVTNADGSATVVFHHGHFIETMYLLMTELRLAMFPTSVRGPNVWDWESDNFAWIDFFWSTLGRSGEAGVGVGAAYNMLQSPEALKWLTHNLGGDLSRRVPGPRVMARAVAPAIRRFLGSIAGRATRLERHTPGAVLSDDAAVGLGRYLSGPLRGQLEGEMPGASSGRVSFVFGHTHKPFERCDPLDGFPRPVSLFNTGGWVVDTTAVNEMQGAAVVLVDDDANVASIRLYNQSDDPASYRVRIAPDPSGGVNPLRDALAQSLDFGAEPWTSFSAAVALAVRQRHEVLPRLISDAMATPEGPAR